MKSQSNSQQYTVVITVLLVLRAGFAQSIKFSKKNTIIGTKRRNFENDPGTNWCLRSTVYVFISSTESYIRLRFNIQVVNAPLLRCDPNLTV